MEMMQKEYYVAEAKFSITLLNIHAGQTLCIPP